MLYGTDPGAARFALAPGYLLTAPPALRTSVTPIAPEARFSSVGNSSFAGSPLSAGGSGWSAGGRWFERQRRGFERRRRGEKVARGEGERSEPATPGSLKIGAPAPEGRQTRAPRVQDLNAGGAAATFYRALRRSPSIHCFIHDRGEGVVLQRFVARQLAV